jgi:cytochrome c oxidase subunit 2
MKAMNMSTRRRWIARALGLAALPLLALKAKAEPQVVKVRAERFVYTPREFTVKAGQPVVIEFTSIDFVHGFYMPDLNVRSDLVPGKVTRIELNPDKPGVYDFLCDNFCGDGHETMHGRMIAQA